MSKPYLAMYLHLTESLGDVGVIVPIRHFAGSRARLAQAIQGGGFFTDLAAAQQELDFLRGQKPTTLSVILDSNYEGRENVIKGKAKTNMSAVFSKIFKVIKDHKKSPAIGGPRISFRLTCGMKTVKKKFPEEFVSKLDFTGHGFYFTHYGDSGFSLSPGFARGSFFINLNFFSIGTPLVFGSF
jgi:hypothetical protein